MLRVWGWKGGCERGRYGYGGGRGAVIGVWVRDRCIQGDATR